MFSKAKGLRWEKVVLARVSGLNSKETRGVFMLQTVRQQPFTAILSPGTTWLAREPRLASRRAPVGLRVVLCMVQTASMRPVNMTKSLKRHILTDKDSQML
jgi:hypothetical protein